MATASILPVIFLLHFFNLIESSQKINLHGIWSLNDESNEFKNLSATVPGGIYTDLMNNKVIGDVFSGNNDFDTRWVAKRNWIYAYSFEVDTTFLEHQNIIIVLDGVDTFATITINNVEIGKTDNMFRRYVFDIKKQLKSGENKIEIKFESPVEKAKKLFEEHSKSYVVPPKCVPNEYRGECHVNHIRKMQASFAWDWGPALPSMGIWKNISIEAYNSSVIQDVTVDLKLNNISNCWDIKLTTYFEQISNNIVGKMIVQLETDNDLFKDIHDINIGKNSDGELIDCMTISIPQSNVKLWWPNGYGAQNLYNVDVIFTNVSYNEQHKKSFKIGFRTIALNQFPLSKGRMFQFNINNIPIFAKGSNIIPLNILPEKGQNVKVARYLLQSAREANMNMLRVWGGGVYESDAFYKIADELGILIWQDLMFACSMYPANEEFLNTVKEEVKHQVRRLQYHPSIALWSGNNENEAALRQNWYGTSNNFSLYKEDYIKLYVDTIQDTVQKNDKLRIFTISSPSNGLHSIEEDYIAQNPQDPYYGDVHFYNYIEDSWNPNINPIPRFASEYGYQSLPRFKTFLSATNNTSDLYVNSTFMNNRQHHAFGYLETHVLINYRLNMPVISDPEKYFKTFLFYSQIQQAVAIKMETEYYRQWRSYVDNEFKGYTMGALYWQLNDVWVAPTWSGIDYEGNWKMLHYFAKDFFAPVIITGHLTPSRTLDIYVVNDNINNFLNLEAHITTFRWSSFEPVYKEIINISILYAGTSKLISTFWIDTYLTNKNCGDLKDARNNCFLYLSVCDSDNNKIGPNNFIFPAPLKISNITTPDLFVYIQDTDKEGKEFVITVTSNKIALFVWLDSNNIKGRFSENGFLMVNKNKTLTFSTEYYTDINDLEKEISITCYLESEYV